MFAHLAGDVRGDDVSVIELDAEHGVGQCLDNHARHLDLIFFGHINLYFEKGGFCLNSRVPAKAAPGPGRSFAIHLA